MTVDSGSFQHCLTPEMPLIKDSVLSDVASLRAEEKEI